MCYSEEIVLVGQQTLKPGLICFIPKIQAVHIINSKLK